MANEPNRAEEGLKRYASERRAEAPTAIDAGTRRVLQGEVARVYGPGSEGRAGGVWWKRLLLAPRFAWAVSLVAILGISFLALKQPAPRREVQENSGAREPEKVLELTQSREGAKAQREELVEVKKEKDSVAPLTTASADSVVVETAAASAPAPAPNSLPHPNLQSRADEARARSATEAPATAEASTRSGAIAVPKAVATKPTANYEISFSNVAPQTQLRDQAKGAEVLQRFKLQEAGRNLVVVDADGSPYSGAMLSQQAGTNTFLVSGTNRTLNQRVDFRGQYFRVSAPSLNFQQSQNQTLNQNVGIVQNTQNVLQDQVRVQGQAVVDNRNSVAVDAQAPAPAQ